MCGAVQVDSSVCLIRVLFAHSGRGAMDGHLDEIAPSTVYKDGKDESSSNVKPKRLDRPLLVG